MKKVTVYTTNRCPKCDMTKAVLKGNDIEFTEINVLEDEKAMAYVKDELKLTSMPVVVIEGEEPFTGFEPDKLNALKK